MFLACYFNSLLQSYFMMPKFVKEIMEFKYQESEEDKKESSQKQKMPAKKEETKKGKK